MNEQQQKKEVITTQKNNPQPKASISNRIPAWLQKENADLLTEAVKDILNCLYMYTESGLLPSWQSADVVDVPKEKPIKHI